MDIKKKVEDTGNDYEDTIKGIEKLELTPELDVSKAFGEKLSKGLASKRIGNGTMKSTSPPDAETLKKEKASDRNFAIIIAAIVLLSVGVFVYARFFNSNDSGLEKVTYGGFSFVKTDTHWLTQWQGSNGELYNLRLRFNPYEAENIPVFGELDENFSLANTYITFDSDKEENTYAYEALAAAELSLNLAGVFGSNLIAACTMNVTGVCSSRPIVTCESTNDSVIYIKRDSEARVLLENNCITVAGNGTELVKAVDKVLYKIYKIIE